MLRSTRLGILSSVFVGALVACSGSNNGGSGFTDPPGSSGGSGGSSGSSSGGTSSGSGGSSGGSGSSSGGSFGGNSSGGTDAGSDATTITTKTTIYASSDTQLWSMDPTTKNCTVIGNFVGADGKITDVAVNAAGEVYVNSSKTVFKAALPASGKGSVNLTQVASIQAASSTPFYALAFTPKDALGAGTGEVLIGGDKGGHAWAIDTSSGASTDLGGFGADPDDSTRILSLSGDFVFYMDASNKPTGLATLRSCPAPGTSGSCDNTNDVLAGVNMAELANAFKTGTASKSLNGGMYGGSATTKGPGTSIGEIFGLGAWEGDVYGFSMAQTTSIPAELSSLSTTDGKGTVLTPFASVTGGWSGAGVTTTVTITVKPPPPPPPPPK